MRSGSIQRLVPDTWDFEDEGDSMVARTMETDVLVVGGGGAGFRAAIGAREKGARATLLSKGPLARCGASPMAGADFTLDGKALSELGRPGAPDDSKEKVFNDIVTQGFFLNNQRLVEQYIRQAPARLKELLDWGLGIMLSDERAVFTSGLGLMDVLLKRARAADVDLLEDVMLIDLVIQEGMVTGALALDVRKGDFIHIATKAVVMATGGWHKAFWPNTGMRDLSGEGMVIAHRAGADLGNMEFITCCCNVLLEPPMWRGSLATYIIGMLAGHKLTNNRGETFLDGYDPYTVSTGTSTEWNKSFVSYATSKEVREGRGLPRGGVHFSRGDIPWENYELYCSVVFPNWKYKALDLTELGRRFKENEPIEVGPVVEYFDGGIIVDETFATAVTGLFAAGECTLGLFGANRVFSAITEMLVHGADAGWNASEYARGAKVPAPDAERLAEKRRKAEQPLERKGDLRPAAVRRRVQEMAQGCLGPIRTGQELTAFLQEIRRVKQEELPLLATTSKGRCYNKEWLDALELEHMLDLLEFAAASALQRTESRGVHFREDHPDTDNDHWLRESVVKRTDTGFQLTTRPVCATSLTPPGGVTPYLDMIKRMMESHSDIGGHH
jgi:succinate dehydrogenase/fumarate reductase flavoprotein subunit